MNKKASIILLIILTIVLTLSGCRTNSTAVGNESETANNNENTAQLNILTRSFPEYDFAQAVAGELANVTMLISPGASVHSFDPSPSDIRQFGNTDLFIYVGGENDVWVDEILESLDNPEIKTLRLIDFVEARQEEIKEGMEAEEDDHDHSDADSGNEDGEHDPADSEVELDEHIWTTPKNAVLLLDAIENMLCDIDPSNADQYRSNAEEYRKELTEIDAELTKVVSDAEIKTIVVADKYPFIYLSSDYGLDYAAAFPGCSDQSDASIRTIAYLINTVTENNLPFVYHVELSNQLVAQSVCEQTGAEMLELHSCENVTREDFENGVTYVDLMKRNIENLKKGLNGS